MSMFCTSVKGINRKIVVVFILIPFIHNLFEVQSTPDISDDEFLGCIKLGCRIRSCFEIKQGYCGNFDVLEKFS